jgi:hypothetical protein
MNKKQYRQVELTQKKEFITRSYIAYIPDTLAILNTNVLINGEPWKVTWCSQFNVDILPDVHGEIKSHRENTGDSLPK